MNTIATTNYRAKWFSANLQETLKAALVAEKIMAVDRSDGKYIWNPYAGAPTTVVQAIVGTYTPASYTTTDDTLTVADEFVVSEHIYDFESLLTNGDLMASRLDEMIASVATAIDKFVINELTDKGTGAYSTPAGGFSQANVPIIVSNLLSKVAGYADAYKGLYFVLEAQDIPGFVQAGAAQGFSFADSWLKNGFMSNYMGVDLYVKPNSTFVTATQGTLTFVNSGHRVFGVKGVATYAAPRGIQYDEKSVTGKTGREVVAWGYCGVGVWVAKRALTVDVTVTA